MSDYFVIKAITEMEDLAYQELGDNVFRVGDWQRGTYYDSGGFDMSQTFSDGLRDITVHWSWASKEAYL